ncbi:ATP-binding protein [Variovorax sp. OV329]|uniref:sensor histidine kinase n=1 Tax=Variovorax sp. OV329 TaxID=1882825 RepID=UPI0008E85076|nr:ATP-binding protein [Variovorax sp. OV329]SFM08150.1 His Kinase A (phospho-acceptor) domain-containing protein [Variovorax sp. OV329]
MKYRWGALGIWLAAWLLASAAGAAWVARDGLRQLQDDSDTQARITHRLLSQQVVQYDAVLATLALLGGSGAEQRLSTVYPSIRAVVRRDADAAWPDARLAAAEAQSRSAQRPQLGPLDLPGGRYWLVMAAQPASFALDVDLDHTVPWADWPMDPKTSPIRLSLQHAGQQFVVQPGARETGPWHFEFHKHLASASQDFDVVAERSVRLAELPWGWMAAWTLAVGLLLAGTRWLQQQRTERRRAEERVRFAQVARLNALGELAAGMAHELNQPLTAVLANTQAARRLLDEEAGPDELATARSAMGQAAEQARRASDVVGRLRRAIERPASDGTGQVVDVHDVLRRALDLLEPELQRQGVDVRLHAIGSAQEPVRVNGDRVALEQIVHNLLLNAMQAMSQQTAGTRRIDLGYGWAEDVRHCQVRVCDSGPGIAPDALPRIFEPFFSTREHGLGLGLSLCETLAQEMGGSLHAGPGDNGRGACFVLRLPRAA